MESDYDHQSMNEMVAIDFDGVIHKDTQWTRVDQINGSPVPGIKAVLQGLRKKGMQTTIYTCRALTVEGRTAVIRWLTANGLIEYVDSVTASKPIAKCYVDDRAIRFNGDTESLLEQINSFKSWTEECK